MVSRGAFSMTERQLENGGTPSACGFKNRK
jgi:hypothetical protein